MIRAIKEIGIRKAIRYFYTTILAILYDTMIFPQLRIVFLRLCGARIGKGTVICRGVKFINLHRTGYKGITFGDYCYIAEEAMFDLADSVNLGDYVSIGQRAMILTHRNVGYSDHPLQKCFPPYQKPVVVKQGAFIGPYVLIDAGATIGENSFVMLRSSVTNDIASGVLHYEVINGKTIPVNFISSLDDS